MNITGMLNSCVGKTALKKLLWWTEIDRHFLLYTHAVELS
jgi:hypothetical protein